MKIYNSLTRKKEDFEPIKKGKVSMYVCGPTVYDEPHIGHARSAYVFDVIRRYFLYRGYMVTFVRNVTDVDDKIIDKARKEFKGEDIMTAVQKVSEKYLAAYHEDMDRLGIEPPDHEPSAQKYIPKMVEFIELLIKRGYAYEADGDVYFDIKKAKDYGKLSKQNLEKMEIGARVAPGERKKDPLDFALWKKAKEDEPSWHSTWSEGRPGWHIECSVMSSDILDDEFDIHGGGIDLIFPHHENEIAQSEGAGKKFARYWLHNGLLTINGEKMAKSLGNFITIKNFGKSLDLLKLFFLSAHYRHPVDYTEESIKEMEEKRDRIFRFLRKADTRLEGYGEEVPINETYHANFVASMDDDFNTPMALGVIFKCVSDCNKIVDKEKLDDKDYEALVNARHFIRDVSKNIFGLNLDYKARDAAIKAVANAKEEEKKIDAKIQEREEARKRKDYKRADAIRKELLKEGIVVEDTKEGPVWRSKL